MSVSCPSCAREYPDGAVSCPMDGTVLAGADWNEPTAASARPPADDPGLVPLTGQEIGDYRFGEVLGAGGMGEVYAAEQPLIGKKVAIKVLKLEIAADKANVKRMLSEARAVNSIRHRGIVDIFNFGTLPDGRPFLVMEFLVGKPLDALLAARGSLGPLEACELLEDISAALGAAHDAGVVHRDLKPANTFVLTDAATQTRYVKLLDFGLAKSSRLGGSTGELTQVGMVVGTPDYMAPEQARGEVVTARTDLYSLGVMAFELLTGQLPFESSSVVELMMAHLQTPAPRASSRANNLPPELDDLVLAMMAKGPADRPESADAVRRELKRIRLRLREGETRAHANHPPSARPASPAVPPPPDRAPTLPPGNEGETPRAIAVLPEAAPGDSSTLHSAVVRARPAWLVPAVGLGAAVALGLVGAAWFAGEREPAAAAAPRKSPVQDAPRQDAPLPEAPLETAPSAPAPEPVGPAPRPIAVDPPRTVPEAAPDGPHPPAPPKVPVVPLGLRPVPMAEKLGTPDDPTVRKCNADLTAYATQLEQRVRARLAGEKREGAAAGALKPLLKLRQDIAANRTMKGCQDLDAKLDGFGVAAGL